MCCNCKNCTCGKNNKVRVCPKCGKEYKDAPAVSRESDKTLI